MLSMGRLFCRMGIHKWRDLYVSQRSRNEAYVKRKCLCCGKEDAAVFWAIGAHEPKWHPDRAERWIDGDYHRDS